MLNLCVVCSKPFSEGDRVVVTVTATYHLLKSTIAYALDKSGMVADPETMHHEGCYNER